MSRARQHCCTPSPLLQQHPPPLHHLHPPANNQTLFNSSQKGAAKIIIQKPIQNKMLPEERPPNWDYCSEACKESSTIVEWVSPNDGLYINVSR